MRMREEQVQRAPRRWRKRLERTRVASHREPERPQRVWSLLVSPSYFREHR